MLQGYFKEVQKLLKGSLKGVSRKFKDVSWQFKGYPEKEVSNSVSRKCQGCFKCFKGISRKFKGRFKSFNGVASVKIVSRINSIVFQGCLKNDPRLFYECLKNV